MSGKITVGYFSGKIPRKFSDNLWHKNVMKQNKKCPQYHLIGYMRLKNSSITESPYSQRTWSLDATWMDDELMMDWLMDGCFPCLLTWISENFWNRDQISHILFFPKSYNPKHMTLCTIKKQSRYTFLKSSGRLVAPKRIISILSKYIGDLFPAKLQDLCP